MSDLRLSSGRICVLRSCALPFLRHYHVLFFPASQGDPTRAEADEVLLFANRAGRTLGLELFGDEECYSLLFHGRRTRRRPWLHIHILPTRNLLARRLAFLAFWLKHLLGWRRRVRLARQTPR